MRMLAKVFALCVAAPCLGGCVVASVASTVVDVGATAVSTTAHVTGSVVKGVAHTVAGSSDDSPKKSSDD